MVCVDMIFVVRYLFDADSLNGVLCMITSNTSNRRNIHSVLMCILMATQSLDIRSYLSVTMVSCAS